MQRGVDAADSLGLLGHVGPQSGRRDLDPVVAHLHRTSLSREPHGAKAEFRAALAERNRLANNLHDTLLQGLAGTARGHFGLQVIRERVAGIGGTLAIDTPPGGGTTITARCGLGTDQAEA